MSKQSELTPTFQLRSICDCIQNKVNQYLQSNNLLKSSTHQPQAQSNQSQQIYQTLNKQKIPRQQQLLLQKLKNDLYRIISFSLPDVVNYQQKANDEIERLQQELENIKELLKKQKQNHSLCILQQESLKKVAIKLQNSNNFLEKQILTINDKYYQLMNLCGKHMDKIKISQNNHSASTQQNLIDIKICKPSNNRQKSFCQHSMIQDQTQNRLTNFPLQMKQKINEAQKSIKTFQVSTDHRDLNSDINLQSEILGCQKQLLQVQVKKLAKQQAEMKIYLQQEKAYSKRLEKQVDDFQKLLNGQKKLNQRLNMELYVEIQNGKQIKNQLFQEKSQSKILQAEINRLHQSLIFNEEKTKQLETQLIFLQKERQRLGQKQIEISLLKDKFQLDKQMYHQLKQSKNQLQIQLLQLKDAVQKKQFKQNQQKSNTQQNLKDQSQQKIKKIEKITLLMKQKYQEKLSILETKYQNIKHKNKTLKNDNDRLYDAIETQVKKEIKLQDKYNATKMTLSQLQSENLSLKKNNLSLKKDNQLIQENLKNQILLYKQLKRESIHAENNKLAAERKAQAVQIYKLPRLFHETKLLKDEALIIKTTIIRYQEMIHELIFNLVIQSENRTKCIFQGQKQKVLKLQKKIENLNQLFQSQRKQKQFFQRQKQKLIQLISQLQLKEQKSLEQQSCLQKQIESYQIEVKQKKYQIQRLRTNHEQLQKFYNIYDDITKQNKEIKLKLHNFIQTHQKETLIKNTLPHYDQASPSKIKSPLFPQLLTNKHKNLSDSKLLSHSYSYKPFESQKSHLIVQRINVSSKQKCCHH